MSHLGDDIDHRVVLSILDTLRVDFGGQLYSSSFEEVQHPHRSVCWAGGRCV